MILTGESQAKDSNKNILDKWQHDDRRGGKWQVYVEEAISTIDR